MKKTLCILLSIALVFTLGACSDKTPVPDGPENEETTVSAPNGSETTGGEKTYGPFALSLALLPELPKMPTDEDYADDPEKADRLFEEYDRHKREITELYSGEIGGFAGFTVKTSKQFLISEDRENTVFSPLNLYIALGMLAEVTDGNTRGQIAGLLGEKDPESLRAAERSLWNRNTRDDGLLTSLFADSFWLRNDGFPYKTETLRTLSEEYRASSFSGNMEDPAYAKALQGWVNEATHGLLSDSAGKLGFDPDTVIALASACYFSGRWCDEFSPESDITVFHGASGDTDADFMTWKDTVPVTVGDGFVSVAKPMQQGASMRFILPDEGTDVYSLFDNNAAAELIASGEVTHGVTTAVYEVTASVPKFDVKADTDLKEGLLALGVTDAFDREISDFSPLCGVPGLFVSRADHSARVKIDEKGCEAAAFTVMGVDTCAVIEAEPFTFTLDRPFIFTVTSPAGDTLFVGVVNMVE